LDSTTKSLCIVLLNPFVSPPAKCFALRDRLQSNTSLIVGGVSRLGSINLLHSTCLPYLCCHQW